MKLFNGSYCKSITAFALMLLSVQVSAKKGDRDVPFKDATPAAAADSAMTDEYGMMGNMEEVVITGQYAPGSAEKTVHKIRVIDRKKIDAMSAQNLRDVLTNEMNVRLSQDNVLGSSMSLQGISGENVKILVDGVPVIGRQNGNIDLSQINLNNIERIEIVEGPMSVSYGTNALAGTINLISKKDLEHTWSGGLNTYYESIGTYNATAKLGYTSGAHTVMVSGSRNYFDGWKDGEKIAVNNKPAVADESRFQQWKPREQMFGDLQYIYKLKKTSFTYKGTYFNEEITNRGLPTGPYGEDALDDKYYTWRRDNALYITAPLSGSKSINFQVAYNDYKRVKNTYYRDLTTLNSELVAGEGMQDTSSFTLLSSRAVFSNSRTDAKVNFEMGYDINVESASGLRIKDNDKKIGDYAAFGSLEYQPANGLVIRPGLRFTHNTIYKAPLIPSLNVRYAIANTGLTIRAAYAKGFRSPTLKELFFYFYDVNHNIRGNEELKAENSDNYNIDFSYAKTQGKNALKASVGGYYNSISNMISLAQASDNPIDYTYVNIGEYKTLGMQASAELKVNTFTVSVGGLYTGRYNQLYADGIGKEFIYSPEFRANIMHTFPKADVTAAVFYKYTGRTPGYAVDAQDNVLQTTISHYQVADASISKGLFDKKIILGVGCKNLFDVKNINTSAAAASGAHSSGGSSMAISTGRNFFVKMDVNLNSK